MFTSELESGIAFLNIQSDCDPLTAGQGGPKGFCTGEPQKCDVTDVSRIANFWHIFFRIKICLRTGSRGTPLFHPLFNDLLSYLKQYRTFLDPKSGPNRWRRTPATARTDRRTSKIWGLAQKPLRAIKTDKGYPVVSQPMFTLRTFFWERTFLRTPQKSFEIFLRRIWFFLDLPCMLVAFL